MQESQCVPDVEQFLHGEVQTIQLNPSALKYFPEGQDPTQEFPSRIFKITLLQEVHFEALSTQFPHGAVQASHLLVLEFPNYPFEHPVRHVVVKPVSNPKYFPETHSVH